MLRTQKDKYYCQHHYRVGFITNVCIFTVVNSWEKNRERHTEGDRLCDESYLDCPILFSVVMGLSSHLCCWSKGVSNVIVLIPSFPLGMSSFFILYFFSLTLAFT